MRNESSATDIKTALLDAIRQFFEERDSTPPDVRLDADTVNERPLQLATTVLFLQVIAADHGTKHDEYQALRAAVGRVLGIDGEEADTLIRVAEERVKTPLLELLGVLGARCSRAQKKRVVLNMWQLAFADAELAGHEEYFVRKVAHALGLTSADLVETKILAREAFLRSDA